MSDECPNCGGPYWPTNEPAPLEARIAELEAELAESRRAFTVVNKHYLLALEALEHMTDERDEARRRWVELVDDVRHYVDDEVLTEDELALVESWEDADK